MDLKRKEKHSNNNNRRVEMKDREIWCNRCTIFYHFTHLNEFSNCSLSFWPIRAHIRTCMQMFEEISILTQRPSCQFSVLSRLSFCFVVVSASIRRVFLRTKWIKSIKIFIVCKLKARFNIKGVIWMKLFLQWDDKKLRRNRNNKSSSSSTHTHTLTALFIWFNLVFHIHSRVMCCACPK